MAARLRQAGAICLGKLNTFEFASGSMDVFGPARTLESHGGARGVERRLGRGPGRWPDPTRHGQRYGRLDTDSCRVLWRRRPETHLRARQSGGNHSAQLEPGSRGADGAHRDRYRPLPAGHGRPRSARLEHVGPIRARLRAPAGDLAGMRLGVPRSYFFEGAHGEVVTAVDAAIDTMRQLGAVVREVDLPYARYGSSASWAIAYSEAFAYHRAGFFARAQDYTPAFLHKITGGGLLSAEELITAQRVPEVITAEFLEALRDWTRS